MSKFQPYKKPNISSLEQWRDDITEMRSLNWPYPEIVKWLLEEHTLKITSESVRQFCNLRGIVKGSKQKRKRVPSQSPPTHTPKLESNKKFTYDSSEPIDIHRK